MLNIVKENLTLKLSLVCKIQIHYNCISFHTMMNRAISILTLLFICYLAKGIEYYPHFKHITIADGLSGDNINCILQDSKGFIWIGTDEGLNRYDGYQIITYRYIYGEKNTIGGNSVRCLFEDSRRDLWIGLKDGGLSRLNLTTGDFTNFSHDPNNPNSLSYNDVSGIVEDDKGRIWVAVDRGTLERFDPESRRFEHHPLIDSSNKKILNNAITRMDIDIHGHIWLSSWGGGIYRFDIATATFREWSGGTKISEDEFCRHIFDIKYDKEYDKLLISSAHGGLYMLDVSSENPADKMSISGTLGMSLNTMSSTFGNNNEIWIGGHICVVDFKSMRIKYIIKADAQKNSLLSNNVRCMYKDRDGTIWVGHDVGLSYHNKTFNQFAFFSTYNDNTNEGDKNVLSLIQDDRGNIWTGGGITLKRFSETGEFEKKYILQNTEHSDYSSTNQALYEDSKGNIWIGGYSNIITKYDYKSDKFSYIKLLPAGNGKLPFGNVYSFFEDNDGTLWICTETGTVNYNPETGTFAPLFQSEQIIYPEDKSHVAFRDSKGELWIGTEGGLKRYSKNGKTKAIYNTQDGQNGLTNDYITSLIEENNMNFWVGTRGGLHYLDRESGTFKLIKRDEKLYSDIILSMAKDNNGNIWLLTPSEIIKYNHQSNNFITYDESDGLQNGSFQKAFLMSRKGKLLLGGAEGINIFSPEELSSNNIEHPVVITDFQIFNRSIIPSETGILKKVISETENITIKEKQSVITFTFTSPNTIYPNKIKYRYMMEGFDKTWTYTTSERRLATYTNLSSGKYTFRVMASDRDGAWKNNEASVDIEILPPIWRTMAAYIVYVMLILGIIYLIIRYMIVRERERNNVHMVKLEAEQAMKMEVLRTNLFTNISHEFRTPLTLILGPLSKIIEEKRFRKEDEQHFRLMDRNVKRLQRLVNQFLDFRKMEQGEMRLNMKYGEIISFIHEVAETFLFMATEKKIDYQFVSSVDELRMYFDPDKMDKILYNLISNALKYTPEHGKVSIEVSIAPSGGNDVLGIIVSDTGIGISAEGKDKLFTLFHRDSETSSHTDGFGIGLSLTKTLVNLHGGSISVESKVGHGSRFCVILPVNIANKQQMEEKPQKSFIQQGFSTIESVGNILSGDLAEESSETILIVEDNSDMRMYIKSIFPEKYKIYEAKDGHEGYHLALEIIPDIIISDIMMPVMDGMKMVNLLRNNDKVNHIPVIFLTARHSESQIIEGLNQGVEDYVTKPFSAEILRMRIKNILDNRRKLWETYNKTGSISELGKQIADSPAKIEFIEGLNKVIVLHMSDTQFGVDVLASELNMSVDQFSRKLRAFINDTPYNIIFKARMKHAIGLMKDGRRNITEIAYEVGYKEVSNFSRAFKKHFSLTPKEYINSL